jgi:hypothetical protein
MAWKVARWIPTEYCGVSVDGWTTGHSAGHVLPLACAPVEFGVTVQRLRGRSEATC